MSQEAMADNVAKSTSAWRKYESGASVPGGEVFQVLHELGININWLCSGNGPITREGINIEDIRNPVREITVMPPSAEKVPSFAQIKTIIRQSDEIESPDNSVDELTNMPQTQFWALFNKFVQANPVQTGWSQFEIIRRFPEFRVWFKKQKIQDI
jgi:hypothetical protein